MVLFNRGSKRQPEIAYCKELFITPYGEILKFAAISKSNLLDKKDLVQDDEKEKKES